MVSWVEEQFYLIWPLLLLLFALLRKHRLAVAMLGAVVIAVASFALAEATNETYPKFSYFMLPARAGELMVGALLALVLKRQGGGDWMVKPLLAEVAGIAGLAAIGWSLFFLDDLSPVPGLNALYPCVGAALVILAGTRSRLLQWLLANRPMVWIGLISYSLYLWHWPILAYIRYFHGTVGTTHAVLAVLAMLALSFLSYRFVEHPTRRVHWKGRWQVLFLFLLPAALVLGPAAWFVRTDGLKARIEASAGFKRLEEETAAAFAFDYNCQLSLHAPGILGEPRCLVGSESPGENAPGSCSGVIRMPPTTSACWTRWASMPACRSATPRTRLARRCSAATMDTGNTRPAVRSSGPTFANTSGVANSTW